jgi:hypothetical protein
MMTRSAPTTWRSARYWGISNHWAKRGTTMAQKVDKIRRQKGND